MSPIELDDLYRTGNLKVDQEHERWITIFNQLERHVIEGAAEESLRAQREALKEILEFTREHFRNEEELMDEYGYSDVVKHRRMHKEFDNKVYNMYRDVEDGTVLLSSELLTLVRNWFLTHTSTEDRRAFAEMRLRMN